MNDGLFDVALGASVTTLRWSVNDSFCTSATSEARSPDRAEGGWTPFPAAAPSPSHPNSITNPIAPQTRFIVCLPRRDPTPRLVLRPIGGRIRALYRVGVAWLYVITEGRHDIVVTRTTSSGARGRRAPAELTVGVERGRRAARAQYDAGVMLGSARLLRGALSILIVTFIGGCDTPTTDETTKSETRADRKKKARAKSRDAGADEVDDKALITWIQDSQRGGLVQRDTDAFMKIWAKDVKVIAGRSPTPSLYDTVMTYSELEASSRAKAKGRADASLAVRYEDEAAEVVARDQIDITWSGQFEWRSEDRSGTDSFAELYRLRRTDEGWRVYENRSWMVASTRDGKTTRYDDTFWKERDADVARLGASATEVERILALHTAMRFAEAHALAVAFTAKEPENGVAWRWRLAEAVQLRNVEEAVAAGKKVHALDPTIPLPGWVEAAL